MKYISIVILIFSIFLTSCQVKNEQHKSKSLIISSNEIVNDLVKSIGGDFILTDTAMSKGVNPHFYNATEKDVIRITDSSLIIYNGGTLEGRLEWVLNKITDVTLAIPLIDMLPQDEIIYDKVKNNGNVINPHFWHNVNLWKIATAFMTDKLVNINDDYKQAFYQQEETYLYILNELESYIKAKVEEIPESNRVIVTEHNAFTYFGKAYGFKTYYLQHDALSSDVSAQDINELANILIKNNVKVIFLEADTSNKNIYLLETTLKNKGYQIKIGGTLLADTLGENNNYESMMKYNIDTLYKALVQ